MLRLLPPLLLGSPAGKLLLVCGLALGFGMAGPANSANGVQVAGQRVDDSYHPDAAGTAAPPADESYQPEAPPPANETYEPVRPRSNAGAYRPLDGSRRDSQRRAPPGEYGEPYTAPEAQGREEHYEPVPPEADGGPSEPGNRYYSQSEIVNAGHGFFGSVSQELASAVEWAFQKGGRPNGYILGQDAGGAVIAGVRYGEGSLHTKDAGNHKVYWQGPTVGYDLGAEGSKVMVLVYNLSSPDEIYNRFAGVQGAAYFVGGVGVQLQKAGGVTLAPIRSGVGLRLGANIGYLKYTRNPTWNPF